MQQNIKVQNDLVEVSLQGSMYSVDAANLRENIMDLVKRGKDKFRIDLTGVDYMDSTGLGLFIFLDEELKGKSGKLILKGVSGRVKILFERTRLYDVFTME